MAAGAVIALLLSMVFLACVSHGPLPSIALTQENLRETGNIKVHGVSSLAPSQLEAWHQYAKSRNCTILDADYQQIFDDLLPFKSGITWKDVNYTHSLMRDSFVLNITNGTLYIDANAKTARLSWKASIVEMLSEFAAELPDLSFVYQVHDVPRSWSAPLPPDIEAKIQDGRMTAREAWLQFGCDSAGYKEARQPDSGHGFFLPPGLFAAFRGPLPVFSHYKPDNCFSDILGPAPLHNDAELNSDTLNSKCPLHGNWTAKHEVAFWRGANSGGTTWDSLVTEDVWKHFHRQRLVAFSQQHPVFVNASFTSIMGKEVHADAMKKLYGTAKHVDREEYFSYKYQLVVDGNGAPDRLLPALCSGSLVMDASIISAWYTRRIKPWQHYIPIKLDYSNLIEAITWAWEHDKEAEAIMLAASELVNSKLRHEDFKCYWYRLLLEYGQLYRQA